MPVSSKITYLSAGFFFIWLTINIPNIPELFFMDLSNLTENNLLLLRYSTLGLYLAAMLKMGLEA